MEAGRGPEKISAGMMMARGIRARCDGDGAGGGGGGF